MLCNEISWHDVQIRQVSGKFADCAVRFANWPDWQTGRKINTAKAQLQEGSTHTDKRTIM